MARQAPSKKGKKKTGRAPAKIRSKSKRRKPSRKISSSTFSKNKDFLRVFLRHGRNPQKLRKLVDLADSSEISAILEVILNALRGNIRLTPNVIRQLKRNKKTVNRLLSRDVSFDRKRRILKSQSGGFIFSILKSLGSALLGPIISSITGKR